MDWIFILGGTHGFIISVLALVILYADHQGYLYFRGEKQLLSTTFLKWSHHLIWAGLILMIVTGVLLTIPSWEYRLQQPMFYVKMGFVAVLIFNAFAIGKLSAQAATTSFAALTGEQKRTLLLSGGLSAAGWIVAAFIGFFIL